MIITIPALFVPERTYIIQQLVGDMLGLPYQLVVDNDKDQSPYIRFALSNGSSLYIRDAFFAQYEDGLSYLSADTSQLHVSYANSRFAPEGDLPVWFGRGEWRVDGGDLYCEADLLAACFFMLTRWEECANIRDRHERFPSSGSLAVRSRFWQRPVVNEMAEMLWNMLIEVGLEAERTNRPSELIVTHDVDELRYWDGMKRLIRSMARGLASLSPLAPIRSMQEYIQVKSGRCADPYDTFDWLMDLSEQAGVQSRFYFMAGGTTFYDNRYDVRGELACSVLKRVRERGHIVGFHPSYDAYCNEELFLQEKERLQEAAGCVVTEGRHHYLRFRVPDTWGIWERAGMKIDSTIGYADEIGFRSGICHSYRVFDIHARKPLSLQELPLTAMEVSLGGYQGLEPAQMFEQMNNLLGVVHRYRGQFVLLWHNSNIRNSFWKPYANYYHSFVIQGGCPIG
ncbi:polysaccharide deacetylase family protein [Paenibacillus popilliae]|uniref:DUF7033 domain-containing protein n=1 Tax=Paenibacillus popilliae TaxID=78057 RepID=A0ABY3APT6_PAEPP|nr:polysaccharide deacetylase family protein [Paenibacillus sp. SDF0028]TQR42825.1 hypothetical protein C7Y44_22720 [Paenibacillus sp. SDF0028]